MKLNVRTNDTCLISSIPCCMYKRTRKDRHVCIQKLTIEIFNVLSLSFKSTITVTIYEHRGWKWNFSKLKKRDRFFFFIERREKLERKIIYGTRCTEHNVFLSFIDKTVQMEISWIPFRRDTSYFFDVSLNRLLPRKACRIDGAFMRKEISCLETELSNE